MEIKFQNYGQARTINPTDGEIAIYENIVKVLSDAELDTTCMEFIRKSDSYVSACMKSNSGYDYMDVARFKYTDRAKWIKTGVDFNKFKISDPDDVLDLSEELITNYRYNEPYL